MCKKVNYSNETIKTKLRFVSKFKDNKIVWVSCNQTKKLNSNHAYKKMGNSFMSCNDSCKTK